MAAGIIGIIAILKVAMGPTFWHGFVFINWAAISIAAFMVLRMGQSLGLSKLALIMGALFLGLTWEFMYWSAYANTDMIFVCFSTVVFFNISKSAIFRSKRIRSLLITLILTATALFIRPAGLWLIAFCVAFLLVLLHWLPEDRKRRRRHGLIIAAAIPLFFAICLYIVSQILVNPELISSPNLAEVVSFIRDYNLNGEVIRDRPHTFMAPPTTSADFCMLICVKFVYFFAFLIEGFGLGHKIMNAALFIPLYGLALLGAGAAITGHSFINRDRQIVGFAAIIFVFIFAFAHAATIIDFDFRYRLPCYPPIIVLAMLGTDCYLRPLALRVVHMFYPSFGTDSK